MPYIPYASWNQRDIGGLNDNLVNAIESGYDPTAGYQETLTSYLWDNTSETTTVAAGARCVTFQLSDDFVGSINNIARTGPIAITFRANANDTLPVIGVIVTGGSVIVDIQS